MDGWQLSGVATRRSGFPLILTAPITGGGNRPNSTGVSAKVDSGPYFGKISVSTLPPRVIQVAAKLTF